MRSAGRAGMRSLRASMPRPARLIGRTSTLRLKWEAPQVGILGPEARPPSPVVDGSTIKCAGRAVKIEKEGDGYTAKDLWKGEPPHNYNTPVLKDGLLYGMTVRRNFFCANAQTGETVWTDTTARGECGAILDAGSVLLALTSDMNLVAIK